MYVYGGLSTATGASARVQVSMIASEDQAKLGEEVKCPGRQEGELSP